MKAIPLPVLCLTLFASLPAQHPTDARVDPVALAAHYAAVEAELRATPPPADPIVAARRERAIDLLREYRVRGEFGRSTDHRGARVPLFVDPEGRRCAVAFLLDRTGRPTLTLDVQRRCNEAWLVELAGNSALTAWLAAHGLTAAEAARIQAPTVPLPNPAPPPPPIERPPVPEYTGPKDTNDQPAAGTTPSTPRASAPSAPAARATGGAARSSAPRGIPLSELGDASWTQWWNWNRDNFEVPQPLAAPTVARTATAVVDRSAVEQALVSLSSSSNSVERSAATVALGRIGASPELLRGRLEDPAREVRFAALLGLGSAGSAAHTHALISQTRNQTDDEVLSVAFAGLAMTDEGALARTVDATLEASLDDARLEVAAAAAMASSPLGSAELRAKRLDTLKTGKSPLHRAVAAQSLGLEADDEAVAALTMAAGERSVDVRRSAALALGRSHHALALPALQTAFELEHDQLTRAMLLLAIGDHGGMAARSFLCTELTTGSKALRCFAALALGMWGRDRADDVALPIQKALAAEKNRDQRGAYLLALGMLRHRGSLDLLIGELTNVNTPSSTSMTRGAAASALGMIGDRAALAAMEQSLRDANCPWVRAQVARALVGFGHVAIDTLRTTLHEDPLGPVRADAAFALGGIAHQRAAVDLLDVVRDESAPAEVRAGAALGLGRHFRRCDPRLPALRFQHNYTLLPALVAWAFRQEL